MGAARDLGQGEGPGRGISGRGIFRIVAGEGPGDGGGAGAVSGGEAGLLLGGMAPGPRNMILAAIALRARPRPVDAVLDEILGEGGEGVVELIESLLCANPSWPVLET